MPPATTRQGHLGRARRLVTGWLSRFTRRAEQTPEETLYSELGGAHTPGGRGPSALRSARSPAAVSATSAARNSSASSRIPTSARSWRARIAAPEKDEPRLSFEVRRGALAADDRWCRRIAQLLEDCWADGAALDSLHLKFCEGLTDVAALAACTQHRSCCNSACRRQSCHLIPVRSPPWGSPSLVRPPKSSSSRRCSRR